MTVPPTEAPDIHRRALVDRLIQMRVSAGLSGNALAKQMNVQQSRISRIQNHQALPTDEDLLKWADATGHADQIRELQELLAGARQDRAFADELRRQGGVAAFQQSVRDIEREHTRIGEFQIAAIPGPLQTADYARSMMMIGKGGIAAWGVPDDAIEAGIVERLRRQEILYDRGKRIQVVISQAALLIPYGPPGVQEGQLEKLISLAQLPAVELGIIPLGQVLPAYPFAFRLYDSDLAVVESHAEEKTYTRTADPDIVATYVEAFEALREAACTGDDATALIQQELDKLREEDSQ